MRASVVLEPGTVLNCHGSICLSTAGLTKRSPQLTWRALISERSAEGVCLHREQAFVSRLG